MNVGVPLLTVLVPSYNHSQYIEECLAALVKLDPRLVKIWVVDDGSTDDTASRIKSFISEHPESNIEFIAKKNAGLVDSLNIGLARTDTEFFYLVASDDVPNAQGIIEVMNHLVQDEALAFAVGGGVNFFEYSPQSSTQVYAEKHHVFFNLSATDRESAFFENYPSPILLQSSVFRTRALRDIGGWDPEIPLDDYPTFIKLLRKFPVIHQDFLFLPNINVVAYRQHGENSYRNINRQYLFLSNVFEKLAPAHARDRATARALGYYTLVGVRDKNLKVAASLWFAASARHKILSLPVIFTMVFKRFLARFKA